MKVAISGSGDSSRTSSSGSTSESGSEIANIPKSPAWVVNDDNFYKALSWETSGNLQYYIFNQKFIQDIPSARSQYEIAKDLYYKALYAGPSKFYFMEIDTITYIKNPSTNTKFEEILSQEASQKTITTPSGKAVAFTNKFREVSKEITPERQKTVKHLRTFVESYSAIVVIFHNITEKKP